MKKTLTKASSKKSSKKKSPTFPLRVPRLPWASKDRGTKIIKYITKENGELETKEERKSGLLKERPLHYVALRWRTTIIIASNAKTKIKV
jgi:hypothetical protein